MTTDKLQGTPSRSAERRWRFTNEYILRQSRTPKACSVCHKPSVYVLVSLTVPERDFFYVCWSHVRDKAFATCIKPISGQASKPRHEQCETDSQQSAKMADAHATQPACTHAEAQTQSTQPLSGQQVQPPTELCTAAPSNKAMVHAQYALHREFFAQRMRQFQSHAPVSKPMFPQVPK